MDSLKHNPQIQEAAQWLVDNETVAFPTETVYGLGANALNDEACQKIFQAKGRPSDNPLIVHIACEQQLSGVVDKMTELGKKLSVAFWPGPLTLVLPKGDKVSKTVTAGLDTVAVRMPDHPVALALIAAANLPIAAPSANLSGKPSPTTAQHVLHDLSGRIAGVLDGGETGVGLESTVVDVTGERALILRPGGITQEELQEVVGEVELDPALEQSTGLTTDQTISQPRSPGVKYTHYAPNAPLYIVASERGLDHMQEKIKEQLAKYQARGYRVAVLTTDEGKEVYQADVVISLGKRSNLASIAANLYAALRRCDQLAVEIILAESFPESGLGSAIMNRLRKAAGGKII